MNYSVLTAHKFKKQFKKLLKKFPSLKHELQNLINQLKSDPFTGTELGNHCYKIRLGISSKGAGKSGGARVITYVYVEETKVYLLCIYDKSERDSISIKEIKKIIKQL
ncbi:MAG: type II toxin-antitoxin system RelE/ParE family toxin [Chitinophagales bacterium]